MSSEARLSEVVLSAADQDQGAVLSSVLTRNPKWLHVALAPPRCRYSLRVGVNDTAALVALLGADLPQKIGGTVLGSDLDTLCLGPDEWMLLCDEKRGSHMVRAFGEKADGISYALVDISQRNIGFTMSGTAAVQLLNVGCPRDLSLDAFAVGRCTRTVFEHTQIVLIREDEARFQIEIWRSFAPYLASYFATAARGLAAEKH